MSGPPTGWWVLVVRTLLQAGALALWRRRLEARAVSWAVVAHAHAWMCTCALALCRWGCSKTRAVLGMPEPPVRCGRCLVHGGLPFGSRFVGVWSSRLLAHGCALCSGCRCACCICGGLLVRRALSRPAMSPHLEPPCHAAAASRHKTSGERRCRLGECPHQRVGRKRYQTSQTRRTSSAHSTSVPAPRRQAQLIRHTVLRSQPRRAHVTD